MILNREQFKDYILGTLGDPVIEINISDEQLEDRIDDAIQVFQNHHFDGTEKKFLAHTITSTDVINEYIILDVKAKGILTFTGNAINDENIIIGNFKYIFKTTLVNKGNAFEVLIGASGNNTVDNLLDAINRVKANEGTTFGNKTKKHTKIIATKDVTGLIITITGIIANVNDNSIITTKTLTNASWTSGTLTGGNTILSIVKVLPVNNGLGISGNIFNQAFNQDLNASVLSTRTGKQGGLVDFFISQRNINTIADILGKYKTLHFNKVMNKIFIEDDWARNLKAGTILIFEAYQTLNFEEFPEQYNDIWLKKYSTALVKKQWGQNLSKFSGVNLPGGISINGGEILQDANQEIEKLDLELKDMWSLPPLDQIG